MTAGSRPGPAGEQLAVLAAGLRAGAAGLSCAEAGLLISQESWLGRSDFTGPFIAVTPGLAAGRGRGRRGPGRRRPAVQQRGTADTSPGGEHRRRGTSRPGRGAHRAGRAGITAAARAVLHAGGHRDAMVTLPPGIPPHLRRKGER